MPTPTLEQQAIIDAYRTHKDLVIEAGAGAGKTSTLKMLAAATPGRRGVYVAYNRSIATDAQRSFPNGVLCKTAHSLAFASIGRAYSRRLNASRMRAHDIARILRIAQPVRVSDDRVLAPAQLARIVMGAVNRFCYSAAEAIGEQHVPLIAGLNDTEARAVLHDVITPWAAGAWSDITSVEGRLPFSHDCYLKMWQLSNPQLPCEYVLLDEAQDANPAIAHIVENQVNAQKILVGDRSQSIYGWRGAIDAMASFDGTRLTLSQSFRFGQAVADEANKWLTLLDAPLTLRGFERINSTLATLTMPDAILCRTNAEAVAQIMTAVGANCRVALVGGGKDIRSLAEAAIQLKAGVGCSHPELFAFRTWAEVQDYAENDESGSDLKTFVRLIDSHGPDAVIQTIDQLVDERDADVIVSTAHKAKGREWDTVKIASDFREPLPTGAGLPGQVPAADAMLAYVTVTRAQLVLDRSGLAWVDDYLPPRGVAK